MATLASFGCSHSTDPFWALYTLVSYGRRPGADSFLISPSWPQRLASMLKMDHDDNAAGGLSNFEIFRAASKYLMTKAEQGNTMVVQWTELKRYNLMSRDKSHIFDLDDCRPHSWHQMYVEDKGQRHPQFLPNQEAILIYSYYLQQLAKEKGIDVYFISMYHLGDVTETEIFGLLDKNLWVHDTFDHGWLNHVMWTFGEEWMLKSERGNARRNGGMGHMDEAGIDYTAKCMYNLITTGKQISMENENWIVVNMRSPLVYKYNDED